VGRRVTPAGTLERSEDAVTTDAALVDLDRLGPVPPEAPLAMPVQRLDRWDGPRPTVVDGPPTVAVRLTRLFVFGLAIALSAYGVREMVLVVSAGGIVGLEWPLIVFFGVTIPLVMALMKGKDFMIFAWIGLGVILVGLLGHWLGTRQERAHFIYRGGDCAFNADGIIVNGVYQGWGIPGSFLTSAELTPGKPGVLRLVYWFITKTGGQFVDVYAPVPAIETARVEAAVAKLELHEHDEHKKPRRKAKSVPSVPEKPEA